MISIICQFCIAEIRCENIVALAIFLRKQNLDGFAAARRPEMAIFWRTRNTGSFEAAGAQWHAEMMIR